MNIPRIFALLALTVCSTAQAGMEFAVSGVADQERANVIAYLEAGTYNLSPDASPVARRKLNARIKKDVRKSLQPFGLYSPVISSELTRLGENWRAEVSVKPGAPVRWRNLEIEIQGAGSDEPAFQEILANKPLTVGQPALHTQYEQTKARLRRAASDLGYLDAEFTQNELLIHTDSLAADVRLILKTGERFRFGPLIIDQQVINDDLLARYVNIREGEYFSSARLLAAKQTLYTTDFFSTVDVSAEREDAVNNEVPVKISAQPGKRHRYGLGIGYGTDTGYRVSGNWIIRRLNKAGHSLSFDARYSPIKYNFNAAYNIPIGNPVLERVALNAGSIDEDLGDANSHRLYQSTTIVRVPGDWQRQISLEFQDEVSDLVNLIRHDQYWVPSLSMMRNWKDLGIGPSTNFQILGQLQGSGKALGLETNYLQLNLQARLSVALGSRGRLLLRGEAGTTWAQNFDLLPVSRRFFTGGDDSVRGYRFNSISPRTADGLGLGGKQLLVGSIEYDHTIMGPWGLAVFTDTGNAFNSTADALETSVGVGLRWSTVVGVVRIDIAQSITDSTKGPRLHVSVGPRF